MFVVAFCIPRTLGPDEVAFLDQGGSRHIWLWPRAYADPLLPHRLDSMLIAVRFLAESQQGVKFGRGREPCSESSVVGGGINICTLSTRNTTTCTSTINASISVVNVLGLAHFFDGTRKSGVVRDDADGLVGREMSKTNTSRRDVFFMHAPLNSTKATQVRTGDVFKIPTTSRCLQLFRQMGWR